MTTHARAAASPTKLHFTSETLTEFIAQAFPDMPRAAIGRVAELAPNHARFVLEPGKKTLRPGNIVSGPTLMALVDVAAYAVVLAHIGPLAMAVTHTLTITFLRPCQLAPITADARLLKLGRRLASIDVRLWQESEQRLIAQATVGYTLP